VARHLARRASSGCEDCSGAWAGEEVVVVTTGVVRERLERMVSWTPGAEGAPREGVVAVAADLVGTMRRDMMIE